MCTNPGGTYCITALPSCAYVRGRASQSVRAFLVHSLYCISLTFNTKNKTLDLYRALTLRACARGYGSQSSHLRTQAGFANQLVAQRPNSSEIVFGESRRGMPTRLRWPVRFKRRPSAQRSTSLRNQTRIPDGEE